MREAIGGTWLFGIVITFIVFFASFLAVSINYAKAFDVKNNIVDLVGKYEGNNPCARKQISNYLRTAGYLIPGNCPVLSSENPYEYVAYNLDGTESGTNRGYYCISKDTVDSTTVIDKKFYRVVIFFKIDLPMLGDITTFRVKGETESIYFADEDTTC